MVARATILSIALYVALSAASQGFENQRDVAAPHSQSSSHLDAPGEHRHHRHHKQQQQQQQQQQPKQQYDVQAGESHFNGESHSKRDMSFEQGQQGQQQQGNGMENKMEDKSQNKNHKHRHHHRPQTSSSKPSYAESESAPSQEYRNEESVNSINNRVAPQYAKRDNMAPTDNKSAHKHRGGGRRHRQQRPHHRKGVVPHTKRHLNDFRPDLAEKKTETSRQPPQYQQQKQQDSKPHRHHHHRPADTVQGKQDLGSQKHQRRGAGGSGETPMATPIIGPHASNDRVPLPQQLPNAPNGVPLPLIKPDGAPNHLKRDVAESAYPELESLD